MTQEQKAKAYDEALKVLHKYDGANIMFTQDLKEEMFPELKESENEKIREELLNAFQESEDSIHIVLTPHRRESFIAWLKKQGEQKPDDANNRFIRMRETKPKDISEFLDRLTTVEQEFLWEHIAKIRELDKEEQKPADKVEPKFKVKYAGCEYNVLEVKDIAGVTYYGIEDEPNHIDYVKADNCKIISGGYGIKENGSPYPTKTAVFSEQKPAWSEEDEKYWSIIIVEFSKCAGKSVSKDEWMRCNDWLNSLRDRVQPKQEWRKEDENKLNEIIGYLNAFFYNYSIGLQKFNDYKTWLKSLRLRSQWKPSDEQLNNILDVLSFDNCTLKRRELLESLYNDLKKLKS